MQRYDVNQRMFRTLTCAEPDGVAAISEVTLSRPPHDSPPQEASLLLQ